MTSLPILPELPSKAKERNRRSRFQNESTEANKLQRAEVNFTRNKTDAPEGVCLFGLLFGSVVLGTAFLTSTLDIHFYSDKVFMRQNSLLVVSWLFLGCFLGCFLGWIFPKHYGSDQ